MSIKHSFLAGGSAGASPYRWQPRSRGGRARVLPSRSPEPRPSPLGSDVPTNTPRSGPPRPSQRLNPSPTMKQVLLLLSLFLTVDVFAASGAVEVRRLPEGAMQPLAITEDSGTVHLVWLQGDPKSCDVFYQKLPGGRTNSTAPIRVNRQTGSAIAIGTVRGAQLAVGRNGRVHVVWNGSSKAEPKTAAGAPLLYARLDDSGSDFEPERNVMGRTALLDGGASVAADRSGNVYVLWHGAPSAGQPDESDRRVFLARSKDDGATYKSGKSISLTDGVCVCCALRGFADRAGNLLVLYRAATTVTDRPITMLSSTDQGRTFTQVFTDPWTTGTCPMSNASVVDGPHAVFAAWETKGKIQATVVLPQLRELFPATPVSTGDRAKHPAVAVNIRGEALCAWAEGTGWQQGGRVAWRALDARGRPIGESTVEPGLPVWSFPAVFARDDGQFVILF